MAVSRKGRSTLFCQILITSTPRLRVARRGNAEGEGHLISDYSSETSTLSEQPFAHGLFREETLAA